MPEISKDSDPVVQGVIDKVHGYVRFELEKQRDAEIAAAGFFKKPILKLQWELVLGLLLKIIFLAIELAIDHVSKLSPDVVMSVVVRRKRELESRKLPRGM